VAAAPGRTASGALLPPARSGDHCAGAPDLALGWIVETTRRVRGHIQRQAVRVLELYGSAVVLLVLFLSDSLSGLVLWLALPRGVGDYNQMINNTGRTFVGLQRNVWFDLFDCVAVTITVIVLVHLITNWSPDISTRLGG